MLWYGRDPPNLHGLSQHAYDSLSYPVTLQARLAELQDFVHANITQAAASQMSYMICTNCWQVGSQIGGGMGCYICEKSCKYRNP